MSEAVSAREIMADRPENSFTAAIWTTVFTGVGMPAESPMFECARCAFQTPGYREFIKHVNTHDSRAIPVRRIISGPGLNGMYSVYEITDHTELIGQNLSHSNAVSLVENMQHLY